MSCFLTINQAQVVPRRSRGGSHRRNQPAPVTTRKEVKAHRLVCPAFPLQACSALCRKQHCHLPTLPELGKENKKNQHVKTAATKSPKKPTQPIVILIERRLWCSSNTLHTTSHLGQASRGRDQLHAVHSNLPGKAIFPAGIIKPARTLKNSLPAIPQPGSFTTSAGCSQPLPTASPGWQEKQGAMGRRLPLTGLLC